MEKELLKEMGIMEDSDSLKAVEHSQNCLTVYEETLRAMGIYPIETKSQAVENSKVNYANPVELGDEYAVIPIDY